jgi:hypothetical protein
MCIEKLFSDASEEMQVKTSSNHSQTIDSTPHSLHLQVGEPRVSCVKGSGFRRRSDWPLNAAMILVCPRKEKSPFVLAHMISHDQSEHQSSPLELAVNGIYAISAHNIIDRSLQTPLEVRKTLAIYLSPTW